MKRAKAKAEGWETFGREVEALDGAGAAFLAISQDAARVANGGKVWMDWTPGGPFARAAAVASKYADTNPFTHPDFPDPLAELSGMMDTLARLAALCAEGGEPEAFARMGAVDLAARARMLYAVAGMRLDASFGRERMRAECAAEVAAARAELAKVKGDKAAFRRWKRAEKADRNAVRALDVARLLGTAGWTVEQVAEEKGVSVSTVERLARTARARGILAKRTQGRRGPGRLVTGKAGAIALEHGTSEPGED